MIKAEEVRYGNYIWQNIREKRKKVTGLSARQINASNGKYFDGIPISKEILFSCGFSEKDMADLGIYIYLTISHEITLSLNEGTIWIGEHDTRVRYLHQLQNLYYALTQTELTINL